MKTLLWRQRSPLRAAGTWHASQMCPESSRGDLVLGSWVPAPWRMQLEPALCGAGEAVAGQGLQVCGQQGCLLSWARPWGVCPGHDAGLSVDACCKHASWRQGAFKKGARQGPPVCGRLTHVRQALPTDCLDAVMAPERHIGCRCGACLLDFC